MLDILELAADPIKEKLPAGEETHREVYFQALMDRLRERNQVNEAIIIKFIRRNTKKRVKSKLTLPIMQGLSLGQTATELSKEMNVRRPSSSCLREQPSQTDPYSLQEVKPCELKTTNNTMSETEPSVLSTTHTNPHADTLHLLQHVQQSDKKISQNETSNTQGGTRCPNSFTKYLRNFFISKLTQNSRLREHKLEMRMRARKSYHGRVQTEVQTELKQKIKVKSLVFGQSEVVCAREAGSITEIPNQARLQTQIHVETKQSRYGRVQEGHKGDKGVLPGIHNSLAARNKRCLENYIRLHQDPVKRDKPLDFRTVKLPTEAQIVYHDAISGGSRRGVGRLGALHVRRM